MDNIDQKTIDWLNNVSYDNTEETTTVDEPRPKFVKLLSSKSRGVIWYKVSKASSGDTEILIEATPKEIKKWNLK